MMDTVGAQAAHTRTTLVQVKPEHYSLHTQAEEMDVRTLINHLVWSLDFRARCGRGEDPPMDEEVTDVIGDDPVGAYDRAVDAVTAAFSDPEALARNYEFPYGTLPGEMVLGTALLEVVLHGWDLAKAIGVDPTIDPPVASMLLSAARGAVTEDMRKPKGDIYPPIVPVPDDASPSDQLVAFLGRRP